MEDATQATENHQSPPKKAEIDGPLAATTGEVGPTAGVPDTGSQSMGNGELTTPSTMTVSSDTSSDHSTRVEEMLKTIIDETTRTGGVSIVKLSALSHSVVSMETHQRNLLEVVNELIAITHDSQKIITSNLAQTYHLTKVVGKLTDVLTTGGDQTLARPSLGDLFEVHGLVMGVDSKIKSARVAVFRTSSGPLRKTVSALFELEDSEFIRTFFEENKTFPARGLIQNIVAKLWEQAANGWETSGVDRFAHIIELQSSDDTASTPTCSRLSAITSTATHDVDTMRLSRHLVQDFSQRIHMKMTEGPLEDIRSIQVPAIGEYV